MTKNPNPVRLREAWVLCFILGVIMLNFPFLQIFNKDASVFGFPLLFLYFFLGWPASILVIYLFCRRLKKETGGDDSEQDQQ